jgi:RNA polymerase sigma factor (sigma-70 family)
VPSTNPNLPDAVLVSRTLARDPTSFDILVRRYQDFAVGYAYALLGDWGLAEDAAQEAFFEAFRELGSLREPAAWAGWFKRIVLKHADRIARKRWRHDAPLDTGAGRGDVRPLWTEPDPTAEGDTSERGRLVRQAIATLSTEKRTVVVLHYFGARSVAEIAAFLEVPAGTVKSRMHAARSAVERRIRGMVEEEMSAHRPSRDTKFAERVAELIAAARTGDVDAANRLLNQTPELATEEGAHPIWGGRPTALQVAIENRQHGVARALLEAGADPNHPSTAYGGWTPLFSALHGRDGEMVALLRSHGAVTGPFEAALSGDEQRLRELLDDDPALVRARGVNEGIPLHAAATEAVARLLVERGSPLDAIDCYGSSPARSAAYAGVRRRDVARYLVSLIGERDLHLLVAMDDREGVSAMLLDDPSIVNAQRDGIDPASGFGATPLHVAVALEQIEMMRLLLDAGADPNSEERDGATPLHYAAKTGNTDVAALLLSRGARRDIRDRAHHATAAGWAEFFGQPVLAKLLQ